MNAPILVLRLLHIVSGAFWVGSVSATVFVVEPAAKAFGLDGERFLAHIALRRRFVLVLTIAATTAIGAGALLYWIDSGGLRIEWITSHTGLGFTAGAVAALSAYVIVPLFFRAELDRLSALATGRTNGTETETDPERGESERAERHFRRWSLIQVTLLIFAIAAMATARYLP